MFEVKVSIYGPEGEDLGYSAICDKAELDELLKTYNSGEISYKELPQGDISLSGETCFCPYCMKVQSIKKKQELYTCSSCGKKFVIFKH